MNEMWTVVRFTLQNKLRSKAFRVMTIILAVIMCVAINAPQLASKLSSHEPAKIGVFGQAGGMAQTLSDYFGKEEKPEAQIVVLDDTGNEVSNEEAAKQLIADKKIKGYLQFVGMSAKVGVAEGSEGAFPKVVYKSLNSADFGLRATLKNALQAVKLELAVQSLGLSSTQLKALNEPVNFDSMQISAVGKTEGGRSESEMEAAYVLVYALLLLLYIGVIGFGNMVATEITAEKSTRVMEVLIASVAPLKQMFGKIIGICLIGLLQIAIFVAVAAANLLVPQNRDWLGHFHISMSEIPFELLVYFIIFYIAGYFLYATIFAAIGSLVSRTEDVGQAIMPVTFLIVAGFMIAMYGLKQPNAPLVAIMAFVPFFTPLIMFLRIGLGDPAVWEIWLSIAILVAAIIGMGWLSAKIYRTGVLMYGKRPSWKELRRAMRAYKV
ncbi:MAG: ABC-type Na+ efflux pump, permease component [Paenibacillaceae bacterium]|jgi:ABC-2 type transport system permease protein|nr:ABC-type Na+ efflux pump, permease component [Paenibacillaceae bacterium]